MSSKDSKPLREHPYEQGFLLLLIIAAFAGLTLLFRPFLRLWPCRW